MLHPLQRKIAALRGRVRLLVAVYGMSCVVAAVLGAVIVLGLTDYVFRFQDRGIRIICSLLVLGILGWTCYRYLYLSLVVRLRDVDLASRLQRKFPVLEDKLVSAVEFLGQSEDDPLAGSAALRRAVVAQTTAETERLDFSEMLDARPPVRAVTLGVSTCLIAAILVVLNLPDSRTAVARLANPFGDWAFAQKTHLKVLRPQARVARGQPFRVEVVDTHRRRLPREVWIDYRIEEADGTITEETELMRPVVGGFVAGKDERKEAVVAVRPAVVRPFQYRVSGGDDRSMQWTSVEVVEPPAIESFSVELVPPRYTGWPAEKASRSLRVLVGTRMRFSGKTTKPLKSVDLCLVGAESEAAQQAAGGDRQPDFRIPGRPDDDGYRFAVPEAEVTRQIAGQPGTYRYWFELTDRRGIRGGQDQSWELHIEEDLPPMVSIERPGDDVYVTSRAVVPLQVAAADDGLIREMALEFRPADHLGIGDTPPGAPPPEPTVVRLYTGPEEVPRQSAGGLAGGAERGDRRVIEYRWELSELELLPGTQLLFHATATDYRPGSGRSEPRRLLVITDDELQDRLADRKDLILAELTRVLKMQRAGRAQVGSLQIRCDELEHLERLDVDHLRAAELNQRRVRSRLTDRGEGVPLHILSLLADLDNNRIDGPDVRRHMEDLLLKIERLDQEHLPIIGRELTAAIKAAGIRLEDRSTSPSGEEAKPVQPPADTSVAQSLGSAGGHQDRVIAALQQMLDRLAQWDDYRRFHREIGQLRREQKELAERTSEVGRRTATRESKDLPPRERADLKGLEREQLELARRLDRIQAAMEQTGRQLQQADPLAAQTVIDAVDETRRLAISGQMRSSADHLGGNRIGAALERQAQIADDLQEVLDILANRRQHELARLVKKLQEAETELAEIQRKQTGLQKKLDADSQGEEEAQRRRQLLQLSREQQLLREEAQRTARRLKRLMAERSGDTIEQAAGQMGRAGDRAAAGDRQGARRGAEEAEKTLELAREQLARRLQRARAELAMEQMARLQDALKHLQRMQQQVIDETGRFEQLRQTQGRLSRAQSASLGGLARQQGSLQAETAGLAEKLTAAGTFHLVLSGAGRDMARAAALLTRRNTGPSTQEAEQNALGRLALLIEALEKEPPEDVPGNGSNGGAGGAGQGGGLPGEAIQLLAELKLQKLMQEEINRRTRSLETAVRQTGTATDEQRREYLTLSEEQGRLAELILQMLPPQADDPEPALDDLPEPLPDADEQSPPAPPQENVP